MMRNRTMLGASLFLMAAVIVTTGAVLADAAGAFSFVGGGDNTHAHGDFSTVGAGQNNNAIGKYSSILGGRDNLSKNRYSTVGGGQANRATGRAAAVSGGQNNRASGGWSAIGGGRDNKASGKYSFAAGRNAKAEHDGSHVWADSTNADFISTGDDQYLIRASGGVGIGTTSPNEQLEVTGNIAVSGTVDGVDVSNLDATVNDHLSNDNDTDATNELNTDVNLNGTTLEITDPGGTVSTELSGLVGAQGEAVAVHLHRDSGGTQYIVPAGKMLILEHLMFNDTWKNATGQDDARQVFVQHSVNPSGPVWSTTLGPYGGSGLVSLFEPLIVPEGKAVTAPFRSQGSGILHKVFLYGKLMDVGNPEAVAVHLHRDSGGTQYIVPAGKMLILEHLMFNDTWKNATGQDDERQVFVQHSVNPSGPVWSTTLGSYGGSGLVTLFRPLIVPEGKAVTAPFRSQGSGILHKVFLYGKLADAGEFPPEIE